MCSQLPFTTGLVSGHAHPAGDAGSGRTHVSGRGRTPNLLLIGPDTATRPYLDRLLASLSFVRSVDSADPHLPSGPVQALVLRDVERLTRVHQDQLAEWLSGPGSDARIVATAGRSLYPMVERGEFSDTLYYRINMVTLLLNDRFTPGPEPWRRHDT
jgi:hypothetical protein